MENQKVKLSLTEKVLKLDQQGFTAREIASRLRMSKCKIYDILQREFAKKMMKKEGCN